jgi:putative DNA primase/helicase
MIAEGLSPAQERFLANFNGVRREGQNWRARCPGHTDYAHSLAISFVNNKVLIKDLGGCGNEYLLNCVGLKVSDLFLDSATEESGGHLQLDSAVGPTKSSFSGWPEPSTLRKDLLPVVPFTPELLPTCFRDLVEDISDRMQVPSDYAGVACVAVLAGCVNRRATIRPKREDDSWVVVPNLWGGIVGHPGFMKSPVLRLVSSPLVQIEDLWRAEYEQQSGDYDLEQEKAQITWEAWRERYKRAIKKGEPPPIEPDKSLRRPTRKRLLITDATHERLHEILSENPAGIFVIRDELTSWFASLDKQGREQERGFFLTAWNGDCGYTIDRIARGCIHVPNVCVSLFGLIQPARLQSYLSGVIAGGPNDDGLLQRFQLLVWPESPQSWKLVDRPPNAQALKRAKDVFSTLVERSADDPVFVRFADDAQELFYAWLEELEHKIRGENSAPPALVAHLAKYRKLMPSLAALFELADQAASENLHQEVSIGLDHARQAAAFCDYLESHARRIYRVVSHDGRAARELARHIEHGDLPHVFRTRDVYLKGWRALDSPDRAQAALGVVADAGWIRLVNAKHSAAGGRPPEEWEINPKVRKHAE